MIHGRTAWLTALAMCAFAANSLLCRAALGSGLLDAWSFTSVRLGSGALVLMLLCRGRPLPRPVDRVRLAVPLFAYALAFSLAYTRIPAAVGALALFGAVQATMIGWSLWLGERLSAWEWLGWGLSLGGLVGLTLPGWQAADALGTGLMIGAGVAWGAYSIQGRAAADPLGANAAGFLWSVPLALAASLVSVAAAAPQLTSAGLLLAAASGGLASGLGYVVWYAALRGLSGLQAAIVQLSVPPLAAMGAVVCLHEALSLRLLGCGAAILGGIALALRRRR